MPITHHYARINNPDVQGSTFALISASSDVEIAVIFVHGFWGDPRTTWVDFQNLVQDRPEWRQVDAYFYAYDSLGTRIGPNATSLRRFLSAVFPSAEPKLFSTDKTDRKLAALAWKGRSETLITSAREYSHICFVGHSEGAVVIRRAIVDGLKRYRDRGITKVAPSDHGMINADVRLFAPAIMGAMPIGIKGALLAIASSIPLVKYVVPAALGYSAAYRELSQGSPVLTNIETSTTAFVSEFPEFRSLRAWVLSADADGTVADATYHFDHHADHVEGQNHVSVCKPRIDYLIPVEFVSAGFNRSKPPNVQTASGV